MPGPPEAGLVGGLVPADRETVLHTTSPREVRQGDRPCTLIRGTGQEKYRFSLLLQIRRRENEQASPPSDRENGPPYTRGPGA